VIARSACRPADSQWHTGACGQAAGYDPRRGVAGDLALYINPHSNPRESCSDHQTPNACRRETAKEGSNLRESIRLPSREGKRSFRVCSCAHVGPLPEAVGTLLGHRGRAQATAAPAKRSPAAGAPSSAATTGLSPASPHGCWQCCPAGRDPSRLPTGSHHRTGW
jgi:hypothetical protein